MLVSKLSNALGVEIRDFCFSDVSNRNESYFREMLANNGLLVIRNCRLEPNELLRFSNFFGKITSYTRSKFSLESHPEILILSNVIVNGKEVGSPVSGRVWHIDGHYLDEIPSNTILNMRTLQESGGDTYFSNMQAAYSSLSQQTKKKIEKLNLIISRVKSRPYNYPERGPLTEEELAEWKDVIHPIVLRHPTTDKKALAVGGNVPWQITGFDKYSSIALVTFLQEWAALARFQYKHVWRNNDLIIWDNRVVMHKASPYQGDRLLYRTTTS